MKILMIDVNYGSSSTGKIVQSIHEFMLEGNHESIACFGRGIKVREKNVYKFGINLETYIHAFIARLTGINGFFSFFSTIKLVKKIKRFKPDIVHIHELHAYFVNHHRLIRFLKSKKIPLVMTLHCEYIYTGKCGHSNGCEKFMTECGKCPQVKKYPRSLVFDFTNFMFKKKRFIFENYPNLTIVTPSKWLSNQVSFSFLKRYPREIIYNGINNKNLFLPLVSIINKHNIAQRTKIVLSIAPNILSIEKGGPLIIELAKRVNDLDIKFILIGARDHETFQNGNLIIVGKVFDQKILTNYYNIADLFLIFSEKENFPTTALEALSSGTPILSFNNGGTKETFKMGFGDTIPYGDISAAENFLRKKLSKNTSIKREEISSKYRSFYSNQEMNKNYLNLYQSILEKHD
jgi:glycosyltransferase involved in cell wall biosynthesis